MWCTWSARAIRPCMNSSAGSWPSRSGCRAGTWSSGTSAVFPAHPAERSTTRVWRRSRTPTEAWLMELTNWRELSDRGPDLVPCLDFPGARAAAGFAELAAGVPAGACFLHVRQTGAGPLAACAARWAGELLATGRPVRAVLGYCAGAALATRLADAIAVAGGLGQSNTGAGPPPAVVLFDAAATTGGSLAGQFVLAVESSARYLTAGEVADAR